MKCGIIFLPCGGCIVHAIAEGLGDNMEREPPPPSFFAKRNCDGQNGRLKTEKRP